MPYVRNRMAPASKEYARQRIMRNREVLAHNPASPGVRFTGAYDWFRTALAYAGRRSYRSLDIGRAAHARRDQIEAEAACMLFDAGCEIDETTPRTRTRSRWRREMCRAAYSEAPTTRDALHAAHAWLLFAAAQAEKHVQRGGDPDVARAAAEIKDRAAAKLIEFAEEMDADDYGE